MKLEQYGKFIMQDKEYEFPYHHLPYIANGSFHDERHMGWGAHYLSYLMTCALKINQVLLESPSKRYLDVGCGDGRIFDFIDPSIEKNGCDLSKRAVAFANAFNPDANIECKDVKDFPSSSFDMVSLIEVIEHIPDEALNDFIVSVFNKVKGGGVEY